jgi:elongation factor G
MINQRRGTITASTEEEAFTRVDSEVPLSEMFGFSTVLRSNTQGKAEFSMEFAKYGKVPNAISDELTKAYQEKRRQENAAK